MLVCETVADNEFEEMAKRRLYISVNVSPRQLRSPDFIESVRAALELMHGGKPGLLRLLDPKTAKVSVLYPSPTAGPGSNASRTSRTG